MHVKIILMSSVFLFVSAAALTQTDDIERIKQAVISGDETQLLGYFEGSVEISTPEDEGIYSRNQAAQVLKAFFSKYPCTTFEINHSGNSAGGSSFLIGTYVSKAKTFRTSIFLRQVNGKYLIQELSFEE